MVFLVYSYNFLLPPGCYPGLTGRSSRDDKEEINLTRMPRLKVKEIPDLKTEVPINSSENRIEQIKAELSQSIATTPLEKVEVYDMWEDNS